MFRLSRSTLRLSKASSAGHPPRSQFVPASFRPRSLVERLARYKSDSANPPISPFDPDREKKLAQQKLPSDPSNVTTQSTVRAVVEPAPAPQNPDHDMTAELRHDLNVIRDVARLDEVPRESHVLGLLGTLPYLATSVSTLLLSWNLNKEWPTGNSFYDSILIDHETARHLLSVIEPIQLGYGAIIISFLGAIHWGLEYAEKSPLRERTRFRYGMGLASSVVAWPTLMMPIEYALTAQFAAFVGQYFADARAARKGWAPHWYGTYRFLLTAMVGFAIFLSLVGRSKIEQGQAITPKGLTANIMQSGIADNKTDWSKLEKVEKERRRKQEAEKKRRELRKQKEEEGQAKSQDASQASAQQKDKENTEESEVPQEKSDGGQNSQEKDEKQTGKKPTRPKSGEKSEGAASEQSTKEKDDPKKANADDEDDDDSDDENNKVDENNDESGDSDSQGKSQEKGKKKVEGGKNSSSKHKAGKGAKP